jgi:hypothetical protein
LRQRPDVLAEVADGLGEVVGGGAVAGGAVGVGDVVVDRLGAADDAEVVVLALGGVVDDVGADQGAVAADEDEVADLVLPQGGDDLFEFVFGGLVAGGAEGGAGGAFEALQVGVGKVREVDEVGFDEAFDAVAGGEDFGDGAGAAGLIEDGVEARVEDGGGAAALEDEEVGGGMTND